MNRKPDFLIALFLLLMAPICAYAGEAGNQIDVVFFMSPTCEGCASLKERVIPLTEEKFGARIRVIYRDVGDIEVYKELIKYEKHYGSRENEVLKIFVGSRYLAGISGIEADLDKVIEAELAAGNGTYDPRNEIQPAPEKRSAADDIKERFRSFGVFAVAGAGLVDGINPCAFTTIVFLVSLLAYLGKSRKAILIVGAGFCLSVFATYLLLGLGVCNAIKIFSVSSGVSRGITLAMIALVCGFGVWSLIDYVRFRRSGRTDSMSLGLPDNIKMRIRRIMRFRLVDGNLFFASLLVGASVSLLEAVCTGQVYLPTIVFIIQDPQLRARGIAMLLVYNLMFILPLVLVFALTMVGVGSERIGGFFRRRLGLAKLAMAALFLLMGGLLFFTL